MPISEDILKTLAPVASSDLRTLLDQDLTELFGVTKWEPPLSACLSGLVKGNFPSHTPKSGQERIQNLKYFFELYKDEEFEMSLKLDGSSCTMYLDREDVFGVCSRNLDLKPDESNSFWKQAYIHGVEDRLKIIHSVSGLNLSIQAELVGEGIQENHEKIKGQDLYVFNIWDQHLGRSLTPSERHATLDALNDLQVLGSKPLKHVPVIGYEKVFTKYQTLEALFEFVESLAGMNPGVILEGVVFKSVRPINGSIVSFKIVSNKYLLSKK
jgi:RNA ligase (TIGR02306 family)